MKSIFGRIASSSRLFACLLVFQSGCATSPDGYEPLADREGIRVVVKRNLPQLESCYLEAIEKRPGAEGKIVLQWALNREGRVENLRVKEAGPKIAMATDCVLTKVSKWQFPRPESAEEVEVTYPFFFSENGRLSE